MLYQGWWGEIKHAGFIYGRTCATKDGRTCATKDGRTYAYRHEKMHAGMRIKTKAESYIPKIR